MKFSAVKKGLSIFGLLALITVSVTFSGVLILRIFSGDGDKEREPEEEIVYETEPVTKQPTDKQPTEPNPSFNPVKTLELKEVQQAEEKVPQAAINSINLESVPIDLRSVVGLQCNFEDDEGNKFPVRGSGVFIHSDGYILTNRHVVDQVWAEWVGEYINGTAQYDRLIDCEVRFLDSERYRLPEEKEPYPFFLLHQIGSIQYDFQAELVYLPDTSGLSDEENKFLDYAVLKVISKNPSKYFTNQNIKIYHSPILVAGTERLLSIVGERITVPGYAYQASGVDSFLKYQLLTKDGKILNFVEGDKAFKGNPSIIETEIYPDAFGGRSGSPIFYKGYVIGLLGTFGLPGEDRNAYLISPQTSMWAIVDNLSDRLGGRLFDIFQTVAYFE